MSDLCQWCGGKANAWQGEYRWCSSCQWRYEFATCEPLIGMPRRTLSPVERFAALLPVAFFHLVCALLPVGWIVWDRHKGWRQDLAAWAYGHSYYWEELRNAE